MTLFDEVIRLGVLTGIGTAIFTIVEGWRWLDAAYYTAMVLTTIGFGDFVPKSFAGKICSIVFSLCGIAIATKAVTRIGDSSVSQVRNSRIFDLRDGILFTILLFGVYIGAGTFLFSFLERLNPGDACWLAFDALSTVGLGSVVPTTDMGKIAMIIYSYLGIGVMAHIINTLVYQIKPLKKLK